MLKSVLGDYAISAPANFMLAGRDKHETEIARLAGARFVVCSEINQGVMIGAKGLQVHVVPTDHPCVR